MAVTSLNWTLPGVETIVGQSSIAVDQFSQSALNGTSVLIELAADIRALQEKENALLAKFGGLEGLKSRIAKFKADAANLSGKGLGINFTWSYEAMLDESRKQAQEEFNTYIAGEMQKHLAKDATDPLTTDDLYRFLNLKDLGLDGIEAVVTNRGTTVSMPRRSGGQVGSKKNNMELSNFLLHKSSPAVQRRIREAVEKIKQEYKDRGLVNADGTFTISGDRMEIKMGTKWSNLTKNLTETEAKKDPYIQKNLSNINREIIRGIRSTLGVDSSIINSVFNHMLHQNPYMFFVGQNSNQITGLIGEITAMVLFYDLVGHYPSVSWAAQNTGLSGTQASADIIINKGYGIQVKNSTSDFGMIENAAKELTIGFSEVSFDRLGDIFNFSSEIIEDLYDTRVYNMSYTWGNGSGTFSSGGNNNFDPIDKEIDMLIDKFENLMTMYSSSLLYMDDVRNKGLNVYSGNIGNVLYMINLVPFLASDMLQKILNAIEGRGNNPLSFSIERHKDSIGETIIDEINPNPHEFFSKAGTEQSFGPRRGGSRYLKTSYTFS